MISELLAFLRTFIGEYAPQLTAQYLPIYAVDAVTGQVYITGYQEFHVVATGIASLNIEYILIAVILLYFLVFPLKFFRAVFYSFLGKSRKSF